MQDKAREEKLDDCKLCGKEGDHVLDIWEENWSDDMIQYVGQILQAPNARSTLPLMRHRTVMNSVSVREGIIYSLSLETIARKGLEAYESWEELTTVRL